MEKHAPRLTNPIPPNDQNLEDGMKLYSMNCALCHGGPRPQAGVSCELLLPSAPNLLSDPPDDPEWHLYYTIRTGIRYTGMPSWEKTLSEQDMWKITSLLSHMEKLPPAVQDYWKTTFGVSAPTGEEKKKLKPQDQNASRC